VQVNLFFVEKEHEYCTYLCARLGPRVLHAQVLFRDVTSFLCPLSYRDDYASRPPCSGVYFAQYQHLCCDDKDGHIEPRL